MFGFNVLKSQKIFQTVLPKYFLWAWKAVGKSKVLLERPFVNILVDLHEAHILRAFMVCQFWEQLLRPQAKDTYTVSQCKMFIGIPADVHEIGRDVGMTPFFFF